MSSEEEVEQSQDTNEFEAGRVARLFIYKGRERQGLRQAQLNPVLDEYREKSRTKRKNPIDSASKLLADSMGLTIVNPEVPDDQKRKNTKNFLVRANKYPANFPLPFTVQQKKEFGLLTVCFFIVYFKGNEVDLDLLIQNLEAFGVKPESNPVGKIQELLNKWIAQDYFKAKKKDDDTSPVPKKVLSLGARFYAEFSINTLISMAQELIHDDYKEEEEKDEEDKGDADQSKNEKNEKASEDEERPIKKKPKKKESRRKSQSRNKNEVIEIDDSD